jgi:hypothetical protein
MDVCKDKPAEPRGFGMLKLFVLYVVASQSINVVEGLLPVFERITIAEYAALFDVVVLLLVVVAVCVALRWWRDAIVQSELAPFCAMLGFALILSPIRRLLANAAWEIATLLLMGALGPLKDLTLEPLFGVEPNRMMLQILLGAGGAGVWYLVLKLIFGTNAQPVLRRDGAPARGYRSLLPFLLYAIALPALIGLGVLIRNATARDWLPSEYGRYTYDLTYALGICAISIGLIVWRGAIRKSELSAAYLMLAFVLLIESFHNLIDREVLNVVRSITNDQMPWEESLPIRRTINYVAGAAYGTVLNVTGAAAAYGVIRLVFGRDLAAVVRRSDPAAPKAAC